jgi:hypothetical protein
MQLGPALPTLQGKIVHGGKLHASKEKGEEEKEALTVRYTFTSDEPKSYDSASREKHLPRGFLLLFNYPAARKGANMRKSGLSRSLGRARNASGESAVPVHSRRDF